MSTSLHAPQGNSMCAGVQTDEEFWEGLLGHIEQGRVLPIVGQGVTTYGNENQLLMPWLAQRLAGSLNIRTEELPENFTINDVVCRRLKNNQPLDSIYVKLPRILRDECPTPGLTLCQLASIEPLRFFLSATIDPLLPNAVDKVRYGGKSTTEVFEFKPSEPRDLPRPRDRFEGSTVYQILGQAAPKCEYVVWENDMLEFILALNKHVPNLNNLSRALKDEKQRFLVLGLSFSDWLLRFFMRTVRQSQLSRTLSKIEYIAEAPSDALTDGLVVFFGSVSDIQFLTCDPRQFVSELSRRWHERNGTTNWLDSTAHLFSSASDRSLKAPTVFVSYSREDMQAARRLADSMKAHGIKVWMDRDELGNGMDFDQRLEDQVRSCKVFISLVSKSTESRSEAYFHQERNWAAKRALRRSDFDRGEFYHPVIIDDLSPDQIKREPRIFESAHIVSLPGGETTQAFIDRIRQILSSN